MPLHICFVDYHSEMKFEQLLKIICKIYFLLLLFLLWFLSSEPPSPRPPVCWRRREGEWWRPQCKQSHNAAMMLIMFPKHISGPYPLCWELSIYPFCFHIVLKHLAVYVKRRVLKHWATLGVQRPSCCQVGNYIRSTVNPHLSLTCFLVASFFSFQPVSTVRGVIADWWGPLIAFYL